ncbi:M20/M25/M40 family metallo-hydrolase [Pleionea litopenaei]|uniref:M20/M25/M40 family metallo-hydrolase n=1 Tax=Pleionea litopenaei TaxID=3070815 RepID=A0AA51X5M0_9GAMM|nr:M20/M25/M40 family metallo-hydrolase [Pleionea sp. HL-JVS1]WMS86272.1 M20/M25/M40 family metallo-hydrolase [Pleionea sp. HL-JVS1]
MKQLTTISLLIVSSFLAINSQAKETHHHNIQIDESTGHGWITIGNDAFEKSAKRLTSEFQLEFLDTNDAKRKGVRVAKIQNAAVPKLSEFMHQSFNRCGGFFYHESMQKAIDYAQLQGDPDLQLVSYSIDNPQGVQQLVNEMAASNLAATVSTLSSYNNRYYTQQSGVDAATWIKQQWEQIAQGRSDISVEFYNHSWSQPSVIATIQGSSSPNEIVVVGGHLDSINSSQPSTGRAPGSDDNASGIAVATETLRAIVASGYQPARTVKFMGYAAEEVGLRGSQAIAQDFKNSGLNVIGVAQFDMTGNQGTPSRDIVFMTDYTNAAQNDFMMQLLDTYFPNIVYGTSRCGYGCSDHASWHNQGFAASIPFESNMNDANYRIHTSNDSVFDQNHALKFAKLSAAYVAELAKQGNIQPPPEKVLENGVPVTGLSASQGSDVIYTMEVPAGASNISFTMSGGSGDADLYVRFGAAPTDSTYDCRPYRNGNNESCTGSQSGGTYFVRVKAYSTFSGVTLVGSYDEDTGGGTDPIDETYANISVSQGQWEYYTVDLSAGYSSLNVSITGGSGDADLYVRQGSQPTTSSYDCRPYRWGNEETCSFNAPGSNVWHIGLRGYSNSSGITLSIQAQP